MDLKFFKSREFIVAGVVAAILLAVAGYALASAPRGLFGGSWSAEGCDAAAPAGAPLSPSVSDGDVDANGYAGRIVTYTLAPDALVDADLRVCAIVGGVTIKPSSDGQARVTFYITAGRAGGDAVLRETRVAADFTNANGQLGIGARTVSLGREATLFSSRTAGVSVVVEVPAAGSHAIAADTNVGDIELSDLRVATLKASTEVGDLTARRIDSSGPVDAKSEVGDVTLDFQSVAAPGIRARTEVGDVRLTVPARADVGYEVAAEAAVGDVVVSLGPMESERPDSDGPSGSYDGRTSGYASKPTRVRLDVKTEVGDIRIASD